MKATYQKNYKKVYLYHHSHNVDFLNANFAKQYLEESSLMNDYFSTLSYWASTYSNPLNPVFIGKVNSLKGLNKNGIFFSRDGLFFLVNFFHKFPSPGEFQGVLIINSKYMGIVPKKWAKKIVFYEHGLFSLMKSYKWDTRESLIIKGVLFGQESDIQEHDDFLKIEMIKKLNLKKFKEIKVFMWQRDDYFLNSSWLGDKSFVKRMNKFYSQLLKLLSAYGNVEFIDYETLKNLKNYHAYSYFELNEKWQYIGDDYLDYLMLSRGVLPLGQRKKKRLAIDQFIPLSPYHGYRLLTWEELHGKVGTDEGIYNFITEKEGATSAVSLNQKICHYSSKMFLLENSSSLYEFQE